MTKIINRAQSIQLPMKFYFFKTSVYLDIVECVSNEPTL